jgi:eukaryotic-like serine/threonine-protein kinase
MTSVDEATRAAWSASLRRSPVLRHLSESHLAGLIDDGALKRFDDGAMLGGDGTPACEAFLLVEGTCEVERGEERVRLEAPALVGEIAVLTGTPAPDRVRAAGPVTAIVIPRGRFLAAIRTSAAAGQELTNVVADRLCAPGSISRVGRFPVEGIMGEGGSGRVLRARHPLLGIPLALKMLSHALALSPEGPRAFIREASLLVHLDHPGIVRVLDAFEAHGTFFIVMPWIEGATLREHIDRHSSLRPEQVMQIAEETLDALAVLHAAGLVHRDVKPSNLLVRPSGRVVLIDLGIACQRDASAARRLVGSPSYCSPEQILGRPVDGRSDVYSLACTLYELVFGHAPFPGDDVDAVLEAHLRATPAFDGSPVVPMGQPFVRWLQRCMSRTRTNRPDAARARAELRALAPAAVVERVAPRARVTVPMPLVLDDVDVRSRV